MTQLPIRTLTLYKQGIGYFEREGNVEDTFVSLVVPIEGINDVLKSLNVLISKGGQILGVDYETPEDKQKTLAELAVKLRDSSTLVDLLSSLQGSEVTLKFKKGEIVDGRLIGVEHSLDPANQPPLVVLQDKEDLAQIHTWPMTKLVGLSLNDSRTVTDLGFFLDVNQTEQARTTLTIHLSEGKHQLRVNYLAPGPTWRVSYRLVGMDDKQARLIGWGLFDNYLDEDLQEVKLTLKSGRPISFEYELYESYVPSRPQVSDDPMALDAISSDPYVAETIASISHEIRSPMSSIRGYAELLQQSGRLPEEQKKWVQSIQTNSERMMELLTNLLDMSRLREGGGRDHAGYRREYSYSGPLGDLKASSSYFKPVIMGNAAEETLSYEVTTPVSVRRGHSAMVPIIDQLVEYEELLVYNGRKMPNHPLLVLRFLNTTGQTLEQGPVTIEADGQYLGDGLVQFSGAGDDIQIPYALEFGVLVYEDMEYDDWSTLKVTFDAKQRQAKVQNYQVTKTIYTLVSHIGRNSTVFVELRDPRNGDFYQMPVPDFTAGGHTRWQVHVPANDETSFTVQMRDVRVNWHDITKWDRSFVDEMFASELLSEEDYGRLIQFLDEKEAETDTATDILIRQDDYTKVVSRQDQLRQNLSILGDSAREEGIRNRILDDLESSEDRRRELESEIADLEKKVAGHQEAMDAILDKIFSHSGSSSSEEE